MKLKKHRHGGARQGAGRPSPYGEKTKPIRLPVSLLNAVQKFVLNKGYQVPLLDIKIPAGHPTSLDDPVSETVDLQAFLIKNPADTFLLRAIGDSMINAGIFDNDLLVVDRKLKPSSGKIVIACLDGHFTVKQLAQNKEGKFMLCPENSKYEPIVIEEHHSSAIFGVVTKVIHCV